MYHRYLLAWEHQHRINEERWRSLARSELAGMGTVPNETTMRAWKARKDEEMARVLPKVQSELMTELSKVNN